jgi:FemAB-related protein (PEP-CTERM system-associated)
MNVNRQTQTAEWDAYVGSHTDATLYHTTAWQDIIRDAFGKETLRLSVTDASGQVAGILPLVMQQNILLGKNMLSMPYANYGGVLADADTHANTLASDAVRLAREMACKSLELRDFPVRTYESFRARSDKVMMRLKLPGDPEELATTIGAKVRSQVRRPTKEGAIARHGGPELIDDFYAVFSRNMRDLGTPVYPKRFFRVISEHLGEHCHVIVISMNGEPVAACFLIGYRDILEIPWASSNRDFNRFSVNMLLYWESLKYAIENEFRVFDFGRSPKAGGTYRFKKQWGAQPQELSWHRFEQNEGVGEEGRPGLADRAVGVWKHLPLPVANWLGPRISPDLPW